MDPRVSLFPVRTGPARTPLRVILSFTYPGQAMENGTWKILRELREQRQLLLQDIAEDRDDRKHV